MKLKALPGHSSVCSLVNVELTPSAQAQAMNPLSALSAHDPSIEVGKPVTT